MDQEIDLKTELQSSPGMATRPQVDRHHQFDEHGLKYEHKHHLVLWLIVFVGLAVGLGYYLMNTEAGKQLIAPLFQQSSSSSNNFPVSFPNGSSSSSASENPIPERDFTSKQPNAIVELSLKDLEKASTNFANGELVYPNFDSEVEFGTKAKGAPQTSSSKSSSKASSSKSSSGSN